MPLRIRCPSGHKLIVPDDRAGRSLRCPRCGLVTEVPGERQEPAVATEQGIGVRGQETGDRTQVAASTSGSGVFDWPNAIAAPTTIPLLDEPPAVAAALEPAIEPPPPPVVKPKSRALPLPEPPRRAEPPPLPEPQSAPDPPRISPPPQIAPRVLPPRPREKQAPPANTPPPPQALPLPPQATPLPARSEPPPAPLPTPRPVPPALLPPPVFQPSEVAAREPVARPHQSPSLAAAVPRPASVSAEEWPPAEQPAPVSAAMALGTDRGNVWAAYQLAAALIVAALFSMAPAVWDVVEYVQFPEGQFIARWALVLFLLGLVQIAYAAYLVQLPDWTSVWVVTIYSLALAAIYAAVLGLVLISSEAGIVVAALQLSDKLAGGKAVLWCLSMVSLSTILAFFAGRLSARWHTREATLRGAGLQ